MRILLKILKWLGIVLLLLIVVGLIAVFSRQNLKYDAPLPDITAVQDSAVIAHGKYLVYGPAHCSVCHSDTSQFDALMRGEDVKLSGGFTFDIPGIARLRAKNITNDKETGIGSLTDQQLARAMRYGVGHDGRAIFDFMPFYMMSDSDLQAIISFLRSTTPVNNKVPEHEYDFMGKVVKAFFIKPMGPLDKERPKSITPDSTAKYGEYLAMYVANCNGCHTERDFNTGAYIGEPFAGGPFGPGEMDKSTFYSAPNLTPDPETGHIAEWNYQTFYKRFREGQRDLNSPMPWLSFKNMTDNDIKAIWEYLQTVKPVKKEIGPLKKPVEG